MLYGAYAILIVGIQYTTLNTLIKTCSINVMNLNELLQS